MLCCHVRGSGLFSWLSLAFMARMTRNVLLGSNSLALRSHAQIQLSPCWYQINEITGVFKFFRLLTKHQELQSLSLFIKAVNINDLVVNSRFYCALCAGDDDSTGTSAVKKKKMVRFGVPLSPEFFDRNLPPSTPLLKGGTPFRAPTPGGALQLRSLLKTPQKNEQQTPQAPSDLCSPTDCGASPTLTMPRIFRRQSVEEESEEDGKVNRLPGLFWLCVSLNNSDSVNSMNAG